MTVPLDDKVSVSGQITPGDIVLLKQSGFTAFICNRPDGEEPGQPSFEEIKAVAEAQNCGADHIPFGPAGITMDIVSAFRSRMVGAPGPVLAYCRSGMRSCALWALASAVDHKPDFILARARDAGYALDQLKGMLETLHELGHIPND